VVALDKATMRDRFEAVARSVRDLLSPSLAASEAAYERKNHKRVYYVSMEFLIGRTLANTHHELAARPGSR
jgi:starch phosphorylase